MEVDELPQVNVDEIINEISHENNQNSLSPVRDMAEDMVSEKMPLNGDDVALSKPEFPSAASSKTKYNRVSTEIEKKEKKEILEFFRVLRPHLPRKSKSKAYKMLQNIAKGTVAKSSFQRIIRNKKPKKRPVRKQKTPQLNTKSLSILRRNDRSLYGSSDSCRSNSSCPHCGHSCYKNARY